LTFNGVTQGWTTYDTSDHDPGDDYLITAQVDQAVAQSGLYPWSLSVVMDFGGDEPEFKAGISGTARVVVNDSPTPDSDAPFQSIDFLGAGKLFQYTGWQYDVVTGLDSARARWYDPGTGTWVEQDPDSFGAGDSNLYRYVGNSPTDATVTGKAIGKVFGGKAPPPPPADPVPPKPAPDTAPATPEVPPSAPKTPMTIRTRLGEFYNRLRGQQPSKTAEEALGRIRNTMDQVEDDLSGISKKEPPPAPNMPDGRMYPPRDDFVTRNPDGSISARTAGHNIELGNDGSIKITNRKTGAVEFEQPGAD